MRKRRIIVIVSTLVVIVALIVVCTLRIMHVNAQYEIIDGMCAQDEVLEFNGYSISISNVTAWNYGAYMDSIEDEFNLTDMYRAQKSKSCDEMILSMDVTVTKLTDEDKYFEIYGLALTYNAYYSAMFVPLVNDYNIECNDDYIPTSELAKGESTTIHIVYDMYSVGFTDKQWDNRDSLVYELIIGNYPERKGFYLSDIKSNLQYEEKENNVSETEDTTVGTEVTEEEYDESAPLWKRYGMEERNVYEFSEAVPYDGLEIRLKGIRVLDSVQDTENYNPDYLILEPIEADAYKTYIIEAEVEITNPGDVYTNLCLINTGVANIVDGECIRGAEMLYLDERQNYDKRSGMVDLEANSVTSFKIIYGYSVFKEDYPDFELDGDALYFVFKPFGGDVSLNDENMKFIKSGQQ